MTTNPTSDPLTARPELLTPEEMGRADAATIAAGTPGIELMEAAGKAVADVVLERLGVDVPVLVLAGPGNNGGDGFVAARRLEQAGRRVRLFLLGDRENLSGDAALAASDWPGDTLPLSALGEADFAQSPVIVDALFGAGLARAVTGEAARAIDLVNRLARETIAVDLPSGVNGATGAIEGAAIEAAVSVTFFRAKPGHLIYPGRARSGRLVVADIGIPETVLDPIGPRCVANVPAVFRSAWHPPVATGHKYDRGHTVVVSGPMRQAGAARLAATAALRVGSGLVTIATPPGAILAHAAQVTALMLRPIADAAALSNMLSDRRLNAVVVGPGNGVGEATRDMVLASLESGAATVIDADGLTSFTEGPETLFSAIRASAGPGTVLTPHEGEFCRLFKGVSATDRLARARAAAEVSGAVVVLKGPDTIVAAPDGRAAINCNAPPWLATAGSGDVLSGLIAGLLAQSMPAREAAAMAVWLHGRAGEAAGLGLIAEDLPKAAGHALRDLLE